MLMNKWALRSLFLVSFSGTVVFAVPNPKHAEAKQLTRNRVASSFHNHASSDTTRTDSIKWGIYKTLPLKPTRKISFNTKEGSWTSLDISPDGKTLVFDMMGDLYTMPATGGNATAITTGLAYDVHPRYSPDGKKILFISDRSGSDNVWYIDMEKNDTVKVTSDQDQYFPSACWTPDGEYIVYAKGRRNIKLYMANRQSGKGVQLIDAPANLKTIDPAVSADGRYIYFSQRTNAWNYNAVLPQYQVGVYDRDNGKLNVITSRYGSGFTPVLSKDGKWLVYGSRYEDKTGLVLRNLETSDEKWLAYPVQRDEQESIAPLGVLPAMVFSPDSKSLYVSRIFKNRTDVGQELDLPPRDHDGVHFKFLGEFGQRQLVLHGFKSYLSFEGWSEFSACLLFHST